MTATEPYSVIALSPRCFSSRTRAEFRRNIEHIGTFLPGAHAIATTQGVPPRLVVLPEMAIQGFRPRGARDGDLLCEIPGDETQLLGAYARDLDVFVAGQMSHVLDDDFPGRSFNVAFIVDPRGEVVYRRTKLQVEPFEVQSRSTCVPHDVWDEWMAVKGDGNPLDALYPVADTELGKLGMLICMEGNYPETGRGLAMNGAEVIIRLTYHDPYVNNGWWELQNRAHAHFNNAYVIAPNIGPQHFEEGGHSVDLCGGESMIVDYHGSVTIKRPYAASDTMITEVIDLESLRRFRSRNGFGSWLKDLRTEQFEVIYGSPIYPKNQYLHEPLAAGDRLAHENGNLDRTIASLQDRGVLIPPRSSG